MASSTIERDAGTGCWAYTSSKTGMQHFFDSRTGVWKFRNPAKQTQWLYSATGMNAGKPIPAPVGAPKPPVPIDPAALGEAQADPNPPASAPTLEGLLQKLDSLSPLVEKISKDSRTNQTDVNDLLQMQRRLMGDMGKLFEEASVIYQALQKRGEDADEKMSGVYRVLGKLEQAQQTLTQQIKQHEEAQARTREVVERIEHAVGEIRRQRPTPTAEPAPATQPGPQEPEAMTSIPRPASQQHQPVAADEESRAEPLRAERRTEPEPQGFGARVRGYLMPITAAILLGVALLSVGAGAVWWSSSDNSPRHVAETKQEQQAPTKDGSKIPPKPVVVADNCPLCVVNAEGFRSVVKAIGDGAQLTAAAIQTPPAARQPDSAQTAPTPPAPAQKGPYLEQTEEEWQQLQPADKYARLVSHCKGTHKFWGGLTREEEQRVEFEIGRREVTLSRARSVIEQGCKPEILAQAQLKKIGDGCPLGYSPVEKNGVVTACSKVANYDEVLRNALR